MWLQLHGTTDSNAFITYQFDKILINIKKVFWAFFINPINGRFLEELTINLNSRDIIFTVISSALYVVSFILLFMKNRKIFSITFLAILFQLVIYIISYSYWIFNTRIFCAHIILIFGLWCAFNENCQKTKLNKFTNIIVSIFFILTMMNGIRYSLLDLVYNYSGAKETAQFIEQNIDKNNAILVTDNPPYCMGIVYYLNSNYNIFSIMQNKNIKYMVWDEALYHLFTDEGWAKYASDLKSSNSEVKQKKIYAIIPYFSKNVLDIHNLTNYSLIFQSSPSILKQEGFSIYKYNY